MTDRERIETWLGAGGVPSTDIERRLIRRLPWVQEALTPLGHADIDAAQMGLRPAPSATGTLEDRVRLAQAGASMSVDEARAWSGRPSKPMTLICGSRPRDRTPSPAWSEKPGPARALGAVSLPYVFPGEPGPLDGGRARCGREGAAALHVD